MTKNFTVIGNMLFIHIKITEDVEPKGKLIIDGTLNIECNY